MRGFKGMPDDMTCRGFHYKIGKTYKTDEPIELCGRGFHFCQNLTDCFDYYPRAANNLFFEVEASGEIIESDDKCVCSEITIIRELSQEEINKYYYGYGYGYGDGYGYGYGNGYGNGYGYGNGNGYGYGYGNGDGYGYGNGDGYGNGYGYGYGYGDGYGDGYGYGKNIQKILNFMEA